MSLAIDVDTVIEVLLVDGWHEVMTGSFELDSYEYLWSGRDNKKVSDLKDKEDPLIVHGGGNSGICSIGFRFVECADVEGCIAGPLTAIFAVRHEMP